MMGKPGDTKKQIATWTKQPETEGSKTSDEETPDHIVITEVSGFVDNAMDLIKY